MQTATRLMTIEATVHVNGICAISAACCFNSGLGG